MDNDKRCKIQDPKVGDVQQIWIEAVYEVNQRIADEDERGGPDLERPASETVIPKDIGDKMEHKRERHQRDGVDERADEKRQARIIAHLRERD